MGSGDADSAENGLLPPFFPIMRKGCEEPTKAMYSCLSGAVVAGDSRSGARALTKCKPELTAYSACFRQSLEPPNPKPIVLVEFDSGDD